MSVVTGWHIRTKFQAALLLSNLSVVVVAVVLYVGTDWLEFRNQFASEMADIANRLASGAPLAVCVGDADHVDAYLPNLGVEELVVAAGVLNLDGSAMRRQADDRPLPSADGCPALETQAPDAAEFALELREGADAPPREAVLSAVRNRLQSAGADGDDDPWMENDDYVVIHDIAFEGRVVGFAFVYADPPSIAERVLKTVPWLLGIAVLLLLVAFGLSRKLVGGVIGPVTKLAGAARRITETQDYRVEVPRDTDDEVGDLVNQFNVMLRRIDERDQALARHRETLEQQVDDRTKELRQVNAELVAASEAAEAANKAKSEFLANMSHELRTPLNAIINYSEMLAEDAADAGQEDYLADLERIQTAGRHLLRLINNILDISKIEAGKMDVFAETFAIQPMVRDVAHMMTPLVGKNGNDMVVDCPDDIGEMHSDLTKVRQCLINLLGNASKFTNDGEIRLIVTRSDETVRFAIADTGIGMSKEQVERVFEAFAQADASTTRRYGGAGLGLAITSNFADMLGGSVAVESEEGKGTTFTVSFAAHYAPRALAADPADARETPAPATAMAAAAVAAVGVSGADVTPTLLLVIDDEQPLHDLLEERLVPRGYRLLHAYDAESGLAMVRAERPEIVVLDILMPSVDGWSVLTAIKSDPELAQIRVVVLTRTHDHDLAIAWGASDFVTKPFRADELLARLEPYRRRTDGDQPPNVLVVDDDPGSRGMLRRALERTEWRVVEAENGRAGIDAAAADPPSLILLDLMMPEMDGFQFIACLRDDPKLAQIPVLVITAKDLSAEERAFLNGTAERVVQKGEIDRGDLIATIDRLAGGPQAA